MKKIYFLIVALSISTLTYATAWRTNAAGAVNTLGNWRDVSTGTTTPTSFTTVGDTWNVQNNMTLAAGATWDVTGDVTIPSNRIRISGTGATINFGGNVTLSGAGNISCTAAGVNYTLNIAGNLTLSNTATISHSGATGNTSVNLAGNLSLANTASISKTGSGAAGTFNFNGSTSFSAPQTITNASTGNPGGNMNYNVLSGSFVLLNSNCVLRSLGAYNRIFSVYGTLICQTYTLGAGNTGTFNLAPGATLVTANAAGISAAPSATGSIRLTTARNFSPAANYVYNGVASQNTGTGLPSLLTTGSVTINNTSTGTVTLTQATTFSDTASLFDSLGRVVLGSSDLILQPMATFTAGAGGFSSTKMIIATGNGQVKKQFYSLDSFYFPVGDGLYNYTPATINLTSGTIGSGAYVGLNLKNIKHPNNANFTDYLNRYWHIVVSGISTPSYDVSSANYVSSDVVGNAGDISTGEYPNALPWIKFSPIDTISYILSASAILDTIADFSGITTTPPTVSIIASGTGACLGGTNGDTLTAIATGDTVFTFSWNPPDGLSSTTTSLVVATPTVSTVYTLTTTDGNGFTVTDTVTVNVLPPPVVTGLSIMPTNVCVGSTVTLTGSGASGGGTLVSYNWYGPDGYSSTSLSPVQTTSFGNTLAGGIYSLTVTYSSGCTSLPITSATLIVDTLATRYYGDSSTCFPGTDTLYDVIPIGTGTGWSSSLTGVATVDAVTGIVTAVSAGTTTITYSVTNSCGTSISTRPFYVTGAPSIFPGVIPNVCAGNNSQLPYTSSNIPTTYSITWSGSPVGLPNVPSGTPLPTSPIPIVVLSTCSPGTYYGTITVSNNCGSSSAMAINVVVNPPATPITGTNSLCFGSSSTLHDLVTGGTWSSSSSSVASVTGIGVVSGSGIGVATISYTEPSGCIALDTVTVNPLPSSISGTTAVCTGAVTSLGDSSVGGVWTSGDITIAAIDTIGNVSGVTSGVVSVTYTLPTMCYTATSITVNPLPAAIVGSLQYCIGGTATLTDGTTGGTWSSSNSTKASITSSGVIATLDTGMSVITYLLPATGCYITGTISIDTLPFLTGINVSPDTLCEGAVLTLTASGASGIGSVVSYSWTGASSFIGTTTGVTETYTIPDISAAGVYSASVTYPGPGCVSNPASSIIVNVNPLPSPISGAFTVCLGATSSLDDISPGGTWVSSSAGVATVGSSGNVTSVSLGTTTISYTLPTGCRTTAEISVNSVPTISSISVSPTTICAGNNLTLTGSGASGTGTLVSYNWSGPGGYSTTSSGATQTYLVPGTGASGNYSLSVSYPGAGCNSASVSSSSVTVVLAPAPITGFAGVCVGSSTTLSDAITGGTWSSGSMTNATVSSSGLVIGISPGIDTISYGLSSTGCSVSAVITVDAVPTAIAGPAQLCVGAVVSFSESVTGGIWSSSDYSLASVDSLGNVTGIAPGFPTISYAMPGGCFVTKQITVNITPSSISGTTAVCEGANTTLFDIATGGIWSSSITTVASITTSGMVYGNSSGITEISYTMPVTGCYTTIELTVNPSPAPITGGGTICIGSTTTLGDAVSGGTWSSSNSSLASVDISGVVSGVGTGNPTITYSMSGGCIATTILTVDATSTAISGTPLVCAGNTTTLTESSSSGTWTSSDGSVAVVSTFGVVSGVSAGNAVISYTISTGCFSIVNLTVDAMPAIITGSETVCLGAASTLYESVTGGTWSSGNMSIATVDASGTVTGVSLGSLNISYMMPAGCFITIPITVNTAPDSIIGVTVVCPGATTTLSDVTLSGVWVSGATSIATVDSIGIVTGVATGNAPISYMIPGTTCLATTNLTVKNAPSAITGDSSVCVGAVGVLGNSILNGTWTSSNAAIATVASASISSVPANITGISVGNVTITYALTDGCYSTKLITVNPNPSPIIGASATCVGGTVTLADTTSGGYWKTSGTFASVDSTHGYVMGLMPGTTTVSYILPTGCFVSTNFEINSIPNSGVILPMPGPDSVCIGSVLILTDTVADTGGTWTSTSTSVATVAGGIVWGLTAGNTIIKYTVVSACGSDVASRNVVVLAPPSAGEIVAQDSICVGDTISLHDSVADGTWSFVNTNISAYSYGIAHGNTVGADTILYTVNGFCGSSTVSRPIFVHTLPNPGVITGIDSLCPGAVTIFSDSISGGLWSATNSNATVVDSYITGNISGIDTINYKVTNACGFSITTKTITINALPNTGLITSLDTNVLCISSSITVVDSVTGGLWGTTNTNASVGTTGVITGLSVGLDTVTYSVTNGCGTLYSSKVITVLGLPSPGVITGLDSVCIGAVITLADAVTGGIWSELNTNAAMDTTTGNCIIAGILSGSDSIHYTVPSYCGSVVASKRVIIKALANAGSITGPDSVCISSTVTLTDGSSGGGWYSTNGNASVTLGNVTGVVAGSDSILYVVTNSCSSDTAIHRVIVKPHPFSGVIFGIDSLCVGTMTTLSDAATGGIWSGSNSSIANVSSGIVTGVANGVDTISYTVTNSCGSSIATYIVTVNTLPTVTITGSSTVCVGKLDTLIGTPAGGMWAATNGNLSVSTDGILTGVVQGPDTIIYAYTNMCATVKDTIFATVRSKQVCDSMNFVNPLVLNGNSLNVYPNPTTGTVIVELPDATKYLKYEVIDIYGKPEVAGEIANNHSDRLILDITGFANGTYFLKMQIDDKIFRVKVLLVRN